jgi:hypothetical protein
MKACPFHWFHPEGRIAQRVRLGETSGLGGRLLAMGLLFIIYILVG